MNAVMKQPYVAAVQTPLAYNLVDLQQAAQDAFSLTPKQTLQTAERLYERGLISYPRTDFRYATLADYERAKRIVKAVKLQAADLDIDPEVRSQAWDDARVGSHTGILPTDIPAAALFCFALSEEEAQVYGLVVKRTLALFPAQARQHGTAA